MKMLIRLRRWFRALAQRRSLKQEIDEELQFHLEQRVADNIAAGLAPEDAAREARRSFGHYQSVREECREACGAGWGEDAWRDVRFAFRQLRKNSGFALVAVLSLAVGLALAASMLAVVNAYLVRTLPYPTADRVYHLRYAPVGPWEPRGMTGIDWKSLEDVVADTINSSGTTFYVKSDGPVERLRGLQVSSGFLAGLGVQVRLGRGFAPEEFGEGGEGLALIGHAVWRDRFGSDPEILGRPLHVTREDEQPVTLRIVGVLPPGFWYGRDSTETVEVLTPLRSRVRTYMVRLRDGVPVSYAERRITAAARSVGSDFRPDWTGCHLQSVHDRYVENIRPVLVGITVAVGLVLVLICLNVAVLMLLRAMRRQKEMAVRVALGAKGRHILRMLAAEAGLICAAALGAGLALTHLTLRLLVPLIERQLGKPSPAGPSAIQIDSGVLLVIGGVSLLVAVSLAFIPLLVPWQRRLADSLRSQGSTATDGTVMRRLRGSLIAFEVAGSFVLLVGCGLMIRSAVNLTKTELGFNPEQVLRVGVRLPSPYTNAMALQSFFTALTGRLPADTNSQVALMTAFPPFYPANTHRFEASEAPAAEASVGLLKVGAGYFRVYDVPLRQGREFADSDRTGSEPVAIVSESFAKRLWPSSIAVIGRQIRVAEGDMPGMPLGSWRTIVGVVGDVRQGYEDSDLRDLYLPFLQSPSRFAAVHVRTDRPRSSWDQSVRAAVHGLEPRALVSASSTIVSEDRQRSNTRFLTSMLTGFAVFAAFLAMLGIYGVTGYAVQQREREIAVRMAVGATRTAIIRLFLKDGVRLLGLGIGFGLVGAYWAAGILEHQVFGVPALDLATRAGAGVLMTVAGLFAVWWPARRAAQRDLMLVLKDG